MKKTLKPKRKKKIARSASIENAKLSAKYTLKWLLKNHALYDVEGIARTTGFCARYVRQLCREGKVNHHKLLGRYYMTSQDIAALLSPVPSFYIREA